MFTLKNKAFLQKNRRNVKCSACTITEYKQFEISDIERSTANALSTKQPELKVIIYLVVAQLMENGQMADAASKTPGIEVTV